MMNDLNKYEKPGFEPDEEYWNELQDRLLSIPTVTEADPKIRSIGQYRRWAVAAVVALLITAIPFTQSNETGGLTAEDVALYLENDGAWMVEDLAFYEEVSESETLVEFGFESEEIDLLYMEGVDYIEGYLNTDI